MARASVRFHLKRLWPGGAFSPLAPIAPFLAYALYSLVRSDLRPEHIIIIVVVGVLAYIGQRTKELVIGLYPAALVFLLFDGMRPYQKLGLTADRVHLCDLRSLEVTLFGHHGWTLHDYWLLHHTPLLDVVCAIPYATFILWCIGFGVYLYRRNRPAMRQFMWGFFLLNLTGFITYHLIPAAPPWYFHSHGCVVDLATRASEGPPLARVDAMTGIHYFHGMYGHASSVFGALPSLHCAYPMLVVLMGWSTFGPRLRVVTIAYAFLMIFSAVYLDHHWVIDGLLGYTYAVLITLFLRFVARRRAGVMVTATPAAVGS